MNEHKYFALEELVATGVKLKNIPEWKHLANLDRLAGVLDRIREKYGKPIKVNSGFRSRAVNAAVGGASSSMHQLGLAADICAASGSEKDNRSILSILEGMKDELDQVISYHVCPGVRSTAIRFIHVGLQPDGFALRGLVLCK